MSNGVLANHTGISPNSTSLYFQKAPDFDLHLQSRTFATSGLKYTPKNTLPTYSKMLLNTMLIQSSRILISNNRASVTHLILKGNREGKVKHNALLMNSVLTEITQSVTGFLRLFSAVSFNLVNSMAVICSTLNRWSSSMYITYIEDTMFSALSHLKLHANTNFQIHYIFSFIKSLLQLFKKEKKRKVTGEGKKTQEKRKDISPRDEGEGKKKSWG